jgi:hypothetical protein
MTKPYKNQQNMKGWIEMERKLSEFVMRNLREMSDIDENDNSQDDKILQGKSNSEIFDMFLTYDGIIGYSSRIKFAVETIFDVKLR